MQNDDKGGTNDKIPPKQERKHCQERRQCWSSSISLFPTVFFKAIYKSYFLMGGKTGLCLKEFKSHKHLFFFDRIYDNLLYVPSSFLLCPLTSEKWKTYIII